MNAEEGKEQRGLLARAERERGGWEVYGKEYAQHMMYSWCCKSILM